MEKVLCETAHNRLMSCFAAQLLTHCFVWYTLCSHLEIMPTCTSFRVQAFFLVQEGITHSIISLVLVHSAAVPSFPLCFSSGLSTHQKCPSCMSAGRRLTVPMNAAEIHAYPLLFHSGMYNCNSYFPYTVLSVYPRVFACLFDMPIFAKET